MGVEMDSKTSAIIFWRNKNFRRREEDPVGPALSLLRSTGSRSTRGNHFCDARPWDGVEDRMYSLRVLSSTLF